MVIVAYQQGVQKMKVNRNRLATAGIEGKPLISEGDEQYLGRIIFVSTFRFLHSSSLHPVGCAPTHHYACSESISLPAPASASTSCSPGASLEVILPWASTSTAIGVPLAPNLLPTLISPASSTTVERRPMA